MRYRGATTPPKAPRAGAAPAAAGGPAGLMLSLQRTAGNRAISQSLARKPAVDKALRTGIRAAKATDRYIEAALRFVRDPDNIGRPAEDYAKALLAAAEAELKPSGAPKLNFHWDKSDEPRRGEFEADLWVVSVFPASLGIGPDDKIGDLDEDQQAGLARTVYHETRHAEQTFRVARSVAADGPPGDTEATVDQIRSVTGLDPDVAEAASRMPLAETKLSGAERLEVHDWRNAVDLYSNFEGLVVDWRSQMRKLVSELNRLTLSDQEHQPDPEQARSLIVKAIRGWDKEERAEIVGEIADRVILRTMTDADARLLADMQAIVARYQDVKAACAAMESGWSGSDEGAELALVRAVRDALMVVGRHLAQAYEHMPNEADALAAGADVEARFHELAKRMTVIRKPAAAGAAP